MISFNKRNRRARITSRALPQRTSWRPSGCHLVGGPAWLPRTTWKCPSVPSLTPSVALLIMTITSSLRRLPPTSFLSHACCPSAPLPFSNEAALLVLLRIQSLLAVQLVRRGGGGGGRAHSFRFSRRRPSRRHRRSHSDTSRSRLPFPALACRRRRRAAAQVVIASSSSVPPTEGETHSNDSTRAQPPSPHHTCLWYQTRRLDFASRQPPPPLPDSDTVE